MRLCVCVNVRDTQWLSRLDKHMLFGEMTLGRLLSAFSMVGDYLAVFVFYSIELSIHLPALCITIKLINSQQGGHEGENKGQRL